MAVDLTAFRMAQSLYEDSLISRIDVLGVAIGFRSIAQRQTAELCVKIFVAKKLPRSQVASHLLLPSSLLLGDGTEVRTDVDEISPLQAPPPLNSQVSVIVNEAANNAFRAGNPISSAVVEALQQKSRVSPQSKKVLEPGPLITPAELDRRWRPAIGGVNVAHYRFATGTLTSGVRDVIYPQQTYLLSCSHVLALAGLAFLGDPILQPAVGLGGSYPNDTIGFLNRFVPLDPSPYGNNLVDGAIAWTNPVSVSVGAVADVGAIAGVRAAASLELNEQVQSVGCVTGLLTGYVISINATLKISYASLGIGPGLFVFRQQILTTPMSAFGDSGALLMDMNRSAVGMLFTGSTTCTGHNPIEAVLVGLGISFTGGFAVEPESLKVPRRVCVK
jgi:hypothetical protein